jgi:membrane fusion protein, multidrug efflux system
MPESNRRKTWYAVGAVVVLALVAGTLLALSRNPAPKSGPNAGKPAMVYELASVDVLKVEPRTLTRSLRLSGTLSPVRHAVIKAHSVGTVLAIHVQEGERVRRGQVLAKIDPRNLEAELDSRTAALNKTRADLILATKNRDNSVALLDRKLISQNAFDQTVAAFEASVANEQAAAAQLRMAQIALQDTEIRADFDGVVAARKVQVGERVLPDAQLLTVVDLSRMQLEALVPVADVPSIRVGMPVRFKVDGFDVRQFDGRLERISPQTEQGSRSLLVYVSVTNTDGALKGGMFADGDLALQQTAEVLAVPPEAIHNDANGDFVLVVNNGAIARQDIARGTAFPAAGLVAVDRGLNAHAHVVVAQATSLKPGVQVKLPAT